MSADNDPKPARYSLWTNEGRTGVAHPPTLEDLMLAMVEQRHSTVADVFRRLGVEPEPLASGLRARLVPAPLRQRRHVIIC